MKKDRDTKDKERKEIRKEDRKTEGKDTKKIGTILDLTQKG